jgi:hypothetical protein
VRVVLVDLRDDAEGYVPLDVEYREAPEAFPYRINRSYPELASRSARAAVNRAQCLARKLRLPYQSHIV